MISLITNFLCRLTIYSTIGLKYIKQWKRKKTQFKFIDLRYIFDYKCKISWSN